MIKRMMIFGVLASLLQVVVYLLLIFVLWNIDIVFHNSKESDFITDFAVITSVILFSIIIFVQNLLLEVFNKNIFTCSLFIIVLVIYTIGWGENIFSSPFKTFIFLIAGLTSLTIKFLIDIKF